MTKRADPRLLKARYVDGYRIELTYDDGTQGIVDFEGELWGEAFEPLRDLTYFKSFKLDRGFSTLVWPNDTDLAPEFLYERASASSTPTRARRHTPRKSRSRR